MGNKGYDFSQGVSCFFSSFINIAKNIDNRINEERVFFESDGMKMTTNINVISSIHSVNISYKINDTIIKYLNKHHINNNIISFCTFEDFHKYITESLSHKMPVIIKINSKNLKHYPIFHEGSERSKSLIIYDYNLSISDRQHFS